MACELCDGPGGELVWADSRCRVVCIGDPDYPGFCRVVWQTHAQEMTDLAPVDQRYFMSIVLAVEQALRRVLHPDKVNLASLGNMTPHLHWHVIPRFRDDRHFPNPVWGQVAARAHRVAQISVPEIARSLQQSLREMVPERDGSRIV
jgi:diadenosine tetraphosphate (Ap4A) HIT family hydrolase